MREREREREQAREGGRGGPDGRREGGRDREGEDGEGLGWEGGRVPPRSLEPAKIKTRVGKNEGYPAVVQLHYQVYLFWGLGFKV